MHGCNILQRRGMQGTARSDDGDVPEGCELRVVESTVAVGVRLLEERFDLLRSASARQHHRLRLVEVDESVEVLVEVAERFDDLLSPGEDIGLCMFTGRTYCMSQVYTV